MRSASSVRLEVFSRSGKRLFGGVNPEASRAIVPSHDPFTVSVARFLVAPAPRGHRGRIARISSPRRHRGGKDRSRSEPGLPSPRRACVTRPRSSQQRRPKVARRYSRGSGPHCRTRHVRLNPRPVGGWRSRRFGALRSTPFGSEILTSLAVAHAEVVDEELVQEPAQVGKDVTATALTCKAGVPCSGKSV